ncbi:hypothetical protein SCHPADRAFT_1000564 [Schizopora paradoxa]|uniref:F-box domain-containing protein n=1 Tax=Schizopora paradoxa TaxID=27342 RepID=A0A0H2RBZ3_9AGAM|nr:hypothetical protein SCHPADRAFT_1000564 [Schizopora paradoxa]
MANNTDSAEELQAELVDGDSLDLLIDKLQALQRFLNHDRVYGCQEQLAWPTLRTAYNLDDEDVQSSGIRKVDAARFSKAISGTYQLKNLESLLGALHTSTKVLLNKIEPNVQSAGERLGQLLQDLPEELLMRVLKMDCDFGPYAYRLSSMQRMMELSSVNKHFRQVALSSPDVWATVSTHAPIPLSELYLNWSKNAKLNVQILRTIDLDVFLDKVLPFSSRWRELWFEVAEKEDPKDTMKKSCRGLHLPNLEHLRYSVRSYRENSAGDSLDDIYLSWIMPNLRSISFEKIPPKVFPTSSITTVHMRFLDKLGEKDVTSLHGLRAFLRDSPTIENLEISCRLFGEDTWIPSSFPSLHLDHIRSVEVRCDYLVWRFPETRSFDEHPICRFLQSLHLPNLERFDILFNFKTDRFFNEENINKINLTAPVFSFFPTPRVHPSIKHLELCIQGASTTRFFQNSLTLPLRNFPNLRHLILSIEGILNREQSDATQGDASCNEAFPNLERLELQKCWGGGLEFLRDIFEGMRSNNHASAIGGKLERMNAVWVKRCPFIREEDLLGIIAKDKLVFEEANMTDKLRALLKTCGLLNCP